MGCLLALLPSAAEANPVISFGVQGGQPATETLGGTSVRPADTIDVATASISFGALPSGDVDAYHVLPNGDVLFSITTSLNLGGTIYSDGDIIRWDGVAYTEYFDEGLFGSNQNIDALTVLPNGNLLISTSLSATLFGFAFLNGDVVEVDPVAQTAGLYMGLNEAAIFTGTNADIDALHYDVGTGNLILSVRTDGVGTIGGYAYNGTGASADLIELDLSGPSPVGSLFLDGAALFDGSTRQLDAVFLVRECDDGIDNDGDGATDLDDMGCASPDDSSEHSAAYPCDDGKDNDGDGAADFPADPGCGHSVWAQEDSACSDGVDNDGDGLMDFDGGAWIHGVAQTAPDPQCLASWKNREAPGCGLGFEAGLALWAIAWLRGRRRHVTTRA
jgi:hypothetical protein